MLGADETPAWVDGGWKYVHVACTEKLTLLHAGNRSKAAIDAGGVLAGFTGVLVRDGYAGYDHLEGATHAECGAHLLRALKGVHDGDPAAQVWAEYMANTLLIAKQMTEQAAAAGHTRLSDDQIGFIRAAYAGAINAGRDANAGRPDTKAAKLVERFARDAHDILRFTTDTAIWFTNNQSERDLRPTKLRRSPEPGERCKGWPTLPPYAPTCPPPPNTASICSTYSSNCSPQARGSHPTRSPSQADVMKERGLRSS